MIKKLTPFMKKYLFFIIFSPIAIIIEVLLETRIPYLMSKIVDIGIENKDIIYVVKIGGLMILMAMLSLTAGVFSSIFASNGGIGFGTELRKGVFKKIQSFSFSNIDKFNTASLITRLTSDIGNIQRAFMMAIRVAFRAPVMLIAATYMAYKINHQLINIFYYVIPFMVVVLLILVSIAYPRFKKYLKEYDKMNSTIQENLISIRVVKSFVRSEYEKSKFKIANDKLTERAIKSQRVLILGMPLMQFIIYVCIVAVLWFGGNLIATGDMKTGELISFITYIYQILISLMMIMMIFINLVMSKASLSRIIEVLDEKVDITDNNCDENLEVNDGSIEFKDVCFKYNKFSKENVLENISFKINSGEKIGIIGATGSSKSTLVQLIPRLYEVTSGEILVSGHNVKDYSIQHLRDKVSMVLQKNTLFSGTIKENLRWGDKHATDSAIIQACETAHAHSFVSSFENSYGTDLGQGGVNVSGGQKQRLCIARSLIKEPNILILDDSTSAVDTNTDAKIKNALRENMSDCTVIIIAQRISSIEDCDKVMVLDDGKINAFDTPENLLITNDIYKEIYNSQQRGLN